MENTMNWEDSASADTIEYTLLGQSEVIPGALTYQRSDAKKETHFTPERVKELVAKGDLTILERVKGFPTKMSLKKGDFKGTGATYKAVDLS